MSLRDYRCVLSGVADAAGRAANKDSPTVAVGAALLLGLAVVLVVYPPEFIAGAAARFQSLSLAPNDAIQYWLAWRALVEYGEPWPSLWTSIFNHPEGFPFAVLDGLPLAATIFRPLLPWLPDGFHYFGLWTALVVALQGVGAVALMRAAGVRQALPCVCAAVLALTMPIFVARLNLTHVALTSHFLLFFAIALCVYTVRAKVPLAFVFPAAFALALAMLTTHLYLALQGLVLCAIAIATADCRWPSPRRALGLRLLALLAFVVVGYATCHALGLFSLTSWQNTKALGTFGFSPVGMILGEPDTLRNAERHGVEHEAWLGWGCVLILVAACVVRPLPRVRSSLFAWAVLALALAAISPWLRFGNTSRDLTALVPDLVVDLYATHRATTRLAWPAVICLSFLPLAHVWRTWPRRAAGLLLAGAIPLQLYAIVPYWAHEYRVARLPIPDLQPLPDLAGANRLLIANGAGGRRMVVRQMLHAHRLALDSGIPLAGGRFAREPAADHHRRAKDLQTATDAFYLAPARSTKEEPPNRLPWIPWALTCERWEAIYVCKPQRPDGAPSVDESERRQIMRHGKPVRSIVT